MEIAIASKADIPAIMLIERTEGYQRFVGRWDAERHAAEIENPSSRYYLARQKAEIAGFAILQYVDSPNRNVRLKRIAVQNAGCGTGSRFLQGLLEICFGELDAHRIELFVFVDNERAYRTYLKNGFVAEGIARDMHRTAEGSFRSMRLMSMLRPDWKRLA